MSEAGIVGPAFGLKPTYEGKIKMNVYCIHDKKAKTFETPFCLPNNAYAIRSFQDAVNNEKSPYHKYSQDFELVQLGEYNQDTGKLTPLPSPAILIQATDLKQQEQEK